ncbi:polysaccharide biosynthesis/export family protein [Sphingobacterium sp. DN00404]|uniref:Polysaccharide biosynthesis/export family protein n=1 Tax=Sphingobacterium micropteri TaxID=2763501 RepID=A0ABR7YKI5_9SPHI|nr:polysaccharide biosynthesis/export family protein [Sphingobacterium micropteri]MBD1431828.1 polysaccharide biosynthesis/export family protein [Sphingobacterium micropteri]
MSKRVLGSVLALLTVVVLLCTSCASKKNLVYLQSDSVELNTLYELNAPKLQSGDILAISVTADDVRATIPFNQVSPYQGSAGAIQATNPFIPTYAIDVNGEIDFPKVGKIRLAGRTRTQAMDLLRQEVSKYIVDPGISMVVRNFRVTVLGEVARPGTFTIENDRLTILEALGLAGDMTIYGERKNVLLIREQDGKKEEFRLDLTKRESLNSPAYYLTQNDVVYVEPNGARIQTSKYTQTTSVFVSVIGLIITVISVATR